MINDIHSAFPTDNAPGLSARDHIAVMAMNGLIARGLISPNECAVEAYKYADALIDQANTLRSEPKS